MKCMKTLVYGFVPLPPPLSTNQSKIATEQGGWLVDKPKKIHLRHIEKINITYEKITTDQGVGWWTSPVGGQGGGG
jgi:hypothetical protein